MMLISSFVSFQSPIKSKRKYYCSLCSMRLVPYNNKSCPDPFLNLHCHHANQFLVTTQKCVNISFKTELLPQYHGKIL
ncbi:hypothetical protein Tsubulata_026111 [Turnera subulata]|uniref:Uncharacterized protein n=1 Tax=Turnera subulata TaxID=218843 RepID=A0A9Q0F955_9ROSI|nr:hypothetical protein Tsubulata_026111 [Turnera subulata]